ncbi:MAG TPA: bifunctional oligoribonuclease/PAP phosphatase NrnA [Solirubrobacterales bacterium]|nr:bifunctional oligoribonuclease/PAP phosphatase NrnA [Solirubrobacterales bacterium]
MTTSTQTSENLTAVADAIAGRDRFLLTTHEGPDGDALGSLLAMHRILGQLGKDSVMFLAAKEFPLPLEYRFLPLTDVFHEPPADVQDRTLLFLDCGNIDRMPVDFLQRDGTDIINIDHHHDNTLFGGVNHVDTGASSTAEIIWRLAKEVGAEFTEEIAVALYVGLITDTGKFMYENTDPDSHRMAAELIEAGVSVDDIYRRLYERVPIEKARLVGRAMEKIERFDSDRLTLTYVSKGDYEDTNSSEHLTEGIIDNLRALEGTLVAGVVRDKPDGGRVARKVSLRSSDGSVDVSAIAREQGGGGHKRAAGFGTDMGYPEIVEFVRAEVAKQLD